MEDYKLSSKINELKYKEPKRKILFNMTKAFLVGGIICSVGETIFVIINKWVDKDNANNYTILFVILIASILTSLSLYDKIGQFAGCGSIIPITGFANSITSSTMEAKSEGLVLGVLNNVFRLAGSVIVVSILCGVFSGLIRYIGVIING